MSVNVYSLFVRLEALLAGLRLLPEAGAGDRAAILLTFTAGDLPRQIANVLCTLFIT